jgi:hypothetical protein
MKEMLPCRLVNAFRVLLQSIWASGRGVQKELDEAKLRFAAAEVFDFVYHSCYYLVQ